MQHAHIRRVRGRSGERGAATVEFALVVPLLVTILMFSVFITDLARVKLKLQEAARYMTWEMTSYPLTDFGAKDHAAAYQAASEAIIKDVRERFVDLDLLEPDGPKGSLVFEYGDVEAEMINEDVPFVEFSIGANGGGALGGAIANAFNKAGNGVLSAWGFNPAGQIRSTVRMSVRNRFLPKNYLDGPEGFYTVDHFGGASLDELKMHNGFTMVTNAWNLTVGADAVYRTGLKANGKLSGNFTKWDDHGLRVQVDRMKYLGVENLLSQIPGFSLIERFFFFQPMGTYVVAHNYNSTANKPRNCNLPKHTGAANGESGLVNHGPPGGHDIIDEGYQKCFDTAPFRDTHNYDQSLYRELFKARGEFFMGCTNPMADDPTSTKVIAGDQHDDKRACSTINVP